MDREEAPAQEEPRNVPYREVFHAELSSLAQPAGSARKCSGVSKKRAGDRSSVHSRKLETKDCSRNFQGYAGLVRKDLWSNSLVGQGLSGHPVALEG